MEKLSNETYNFNHSAISLYISNQSSRERKQIIAALI